MRRTFYAIAGDPGGAEALVPVLKALANLEGINVVLGAYRQARDRWASHGLEFDVVDESVSLTNCQGLLEKAGADLLLTATSMNGVDLEKRFILAARELGLPSLAVLDFWANYRPRFSNEFDQLKFLPDRIAVMDEGALTAMVDEGFPRDRLVITGQPVFEDLAVWASEVGEVSGLQFRDSLGIGPGDQLVTFLSQPIAELYGDDLTAPEFLGYTQYSVIEHLIISLMGCGVSARTTLLIRPHPREQRESYGNYANHPDLNIVVSKQGESRSVAMGSDLVVGMTTVLLLEAACLGRPVISLQPNRHGPDCLPLARLGLGLTLTEANNVIPVLEKILAEENPWPGLVRPGFQLFGGSVSKVLNEMSRLLECHLRS